jgi:soluble lytic murein transglycosylase-like protein
MTRIQYRPSAQRRGFKTQQLSTEGIARMRDESNRLIQGMERQRNAEAEQRERERRAMAEDQAYIERITKENNDIELRNLKIEAEAEVGAIQAEMRQADIDTKAQQSIISDLARFSSTAVKFLGEQEAKRLGKKVDEANKVQLKALGEKDVNFLATYNDAKSAQTAGGIVLGTNIVEDGVLKNEPVHETLKNLISNPAYTGRAGQAWENRRAFQIFTALFDRAKLSTEQTFTSVDGKKFSGLEAAANPELVDDLKQSLTEQVIKLFGKDAVYLQDTIEKIDGTFKVFKGQADNEAFKRAKAVGNSQVDGLYLSGDRENVVMAFAHDKNLNGIASALDKFDKQIENPDIPLDVLASIDLKGNGKGYAQDQPKRYAAAVRKRDVAITQRINAEDNYKKAEDKAWVNANIGSIQQAYDENPAQAAMLVKQRYYGKGMTVPTVIANIEREAIKKNKDIVQNLVAQKTKFGNLDLTFVNSIQDATLQKTARAAYEQQELNKYGPEALGIKKGLKSTARNLTKIDPNEEQGSAQTFLVNARLESEYLKQLKLTNDPLKALENVNQMVDAGRNGDKSSPFFRDTGFLNNRLVFPNIETSDREHQERSVYLDKKMLSRGIAVVDQPFTLATPDEMDAAYMSSVSGAMQYPPGVLRVADQFDLKPSEIFNAQRQANNAASGDNKPLLTPSPVTDLIDNVPDNVRKLFLSDIPAQINRGSAMVTGQLPRRASMGGSSFNPDSVPKGYGGVIQQAATENGIPPEILAGLIDTESAFNPKAVSPVGAQGLGQFMPPTAAEFGVDVNDPMSSIDGAARYLRYLVDYFDGDMNLAIYAYNGGMGNIERYGGPIPGNRENEEYLQKVLNNATKYR